MRPIDRIARRKALTIAYATPEYDADGVFYRARRDYQADKETIDNSFESHVANAYKSNPIIFTCILARMLPFSEARFTYQEFDGRPGRLEDGPGLDLLTTPWPNASTSDLLARMEQDASLAGNFYGTPVGSRLRRMRPDWVTILSGVKGDEEASPWSLEADILGYIYHPVLLTGRGRRPDPVFLTPEKVVHYAPIPDPGAQWRGMSWITPVLREIEADDAATMHKRKFFKRGAAPKVVVTYDKTVTPLNFERYVQLYEEQMDGPENAYRTLHLGGGSDAKVVGADLRQLDFRATQGAGETRIAAAAGVGAIIARFSEGLQGSALNQGNYDAAKRQFGDMTLRPLWGSASSSLAKLSNPPEKKRLWYDARDVEFLKDDRKSAADIQAQQAQTIRQLVDAGYTPTSVIDAVEANDFSRLEHSGLYSVQLRQPTDGSTPTEGAA